MAELPSSEGFFLGNGKASTDGLIRANMALADSTLEFLASVVRPGMNSLETGGGWSTVILATSGGQHITINPDETAGRLIAEFLDNHDIDRSGVRFISGLSHEELPKLDLPPLDLILLDGSHAFPIPIIDWFYSQSSLKVGGLLMLDNSPINSVRMLCDFLLLDPNYRFDKKVGECTMWTKIADGPMVGFGEQAINQRRFRGYRPVTKQYVLENAEEMARGVVGRLLRR